MTTVADDRLACWCGEGGWAPQFRTARFGLVRCTSCGCFRIDPPPIAADDESASFYTSYYSSPNESGNGADVAGRRSRFWRVAARVPRLTSVGERALDVGCGEGVLCAELREAGWSEVAGIDVSSSRIARARERHAGIAFYDRPIGETGIERASLDLVTMDNVIEHLPDPVGMLSTLREYVAPGGTLVLITPNMESGNYRLLGRRWTPELAPHAHVFLFTPSSIARLVRWCGYAVEAAGTFHLPPRGWREWLEPVRAGDARLLAWRAVQESGDLFSRVIRSGPMLYVVARAEGASAHGASANGANAHGPGGAP